MKAARGVTLRRVGVETGVLLLLHAVAVGSLARVRLLEHILAPGPSSTMALAVTAAFLVLRVFVLVILPGWLLARLWFLVTQEARAGSGSSSPDGRSPR